MTQRSSEFGVHEDGLPDPFEESDETKRTGEKRGPYTRKFLAVEDIGNWFNDLGQERGGDTTTSKWETLMESFRELPHAVQEEIRKDIEQKMKRNFFKTKADMLQRLTYLITENERLQRRTEKSQAARGNEEKSGIRYPKRRRP